MGFFHEDIAVDTAADLQNITSITDPARVEDGLYYVRATDSWYRYDSAGTPSGSDITPTDNIGSFKVSGAGSGGGGGATISGGVNPIGNVTPASAGIIYIWEQPQTASFGEKRVYYYSNGTNTSSWIVFGGTSVLFTDASLTGDADFEGQLAFEVTSGSGASTVNARYVATNQGTGSDWSQII